MPLSKPRRRGRHLQNIGLLSLACLVLAACGSGSNASSGAATPGGTPTATPNPYNPVYGLDLGLHVLSGKTGGEAVPDSEVVKLLTALQGRTEWVRLYDATPPNQNAPRLAHAMGFKVAASVPLYGNHAQDETALGVLIDDVNKGYVDYAIVGNEEVHVKLLTAAQEVAFIKEVKQKVNGKAPVGTVEPDKELLANPELMRASDLVLANIPPIAYGVPLDKSLDYVTKTYAQLVAAAGGVEVGVGETQWSSSGFGTTVEQEATYASNIETWGRGNHIKMFYFEAFDEPWLGQFNAFGAHWGMWTADLQLKPGLERVFAKP